MGKQKTAKIFTPENFNSLKETCNKISQLCDLNQEGALMWSQMTFLAENITDFLMHPIVTDSGLVKADKEAEVAEEA